jgi:hypothetical protein
MDVHARRSTERGVTVPRGSVKPDALRAKQAEMPEFAKDAAASLGLEGSALMLAVFAENIPNAEEARAGFKREVDLPESQTEHR